MGCCCRKSRKQKELEAELEMLLSQKLTPVSKPIEYPESLPPSLAETLKLIDHDLHLSLKLIQSLSPLISRNPQACQSLSEKIQSLSIQSHSEKFELYKEILIEESSLKQQTLDLFEEQYKDLLAFRNTKRAEIEERIEKVEKLLYNTEELQQNIKSIRNNLKSAQIQGKQDMQGVTQSLKDLSDIEKQLNTIETILPAPAKDDFFLQKLKEAHNELPKLITASLSTLNSMKSVLTESESPDTSGSECQELSTHTLTTLLTSLTSQLKSLQVLESQKAQLLHSNQITHQIESIENSLTKYLLNSEQLKSLTQFRLNRVSHNSFDLNDLQQSLFLKLLTRNNSIPLQLKSLKQKFTNFFRSLEKQDQLLLELTGKFNSIDKTVDEIELKFQEFFSAEVKDLYKDTSHSSIGNKRDIEQINEKLIEYSEDSSKDLVQRLGNLYEKVMLTEKIDRARLANRELHAKEMANVKGELQERVNELSIKVDLLENEKLVNKEVFRACEDELGLTKDLVRKLVESANEKELAVIELRNSVASLKEELDQVAGDKVKLGAEVSDLHKQLKLCKKQLRKKEHEFSELQSQLSNLTLT